MTHATLIHTDCGGEVRRVGEDGIDVCEHCGIVEGQPVHWEDENGEVVEE